MNQTKVAETLEARNNPCAVKKQSLKAPEKLDNTTIYSKAMLDAMITARRTAEVNAAAEGSLGPDKNKSAKIDWDLKNDRAEAKTSVSTVHTYVNFLGDTVKAPDVLNIFGLKVDVKDKIENYKDNYVKNYALSKSHNFLMAKFAQMKLGFFGMMLSVCGVSTEEISVLQKEARAAAKVQNVRSFEENEYTGELLEVMGGNKKQIKGERVIIGELRKQLMKQMENLGFKDHYSAESVNEIQADQCRLIKEKLEEEATSLEYHAGLIEAGVPTEMSAKDVAAKLSKMISLVARAAKRMDAHAKTRQGIMSKKQAQAGADILKQSGKGNKTC